MAEMQHVGGVEVGYVLSEEEGWEALVFHTPDEDSLEIQRALPESGEPLEHCVVLHGGPIAYGALEDVRISRGRIEFLFTAGAQRTLEVPPVLVCEINEAGQQTVMQHLDRLLQD